MPYLSKAAAKARGVRYYNANKEAHKVRRQQWKRNNPIRLAWLNQRHSANQRGIVFNLTFEEFRDFWGDDFAQRGKREDDLQMGRYGDRGAYEIGNIYKATTLENKAGPREKE